MDSQKLKYFLEVAETENITKAAKTLYIGQPSLSTALKRLEDELGTSLFDRKGKSIELNDEGKKILPYVTQIVELMDQVEKIASKKQNQCISLAVSEETSLHNFKDVFELSFPDIQIDFCLVSPEKAVGLLERGEADLAITSTVSEKEHLKQLFSFEQPLLLCIPKTNPLARKRKLSFIETKEENIIFLLFERSFISFVKDFGKANNYMPKLTYATADPLFVFRLLKQGRGITAISEYDPVIMKELDVSIVEVTDISRKVIGYSLVPEEELSSAVTVFKNFFVKYYR